MNRPCPGQLAWILVGLLMAGTAQGQSKITEHVYSLGKGAERPAASIEDVAILAGQWQGEGLGGRFEETWNAPSAGTMVGSFKLIEDDVVKFYELMLLVEEEGSVSMKVKHFNADFTAWEEKPDYVTFRFISADERSVRFSGLCFERVSENEMVAYLAMRSGDELREEKLTFKRVN
jgi:hypothetical protein